MTPAGGSWPRWALNVAMVLAGAALNLATSARDALAVRPAPGWRIDPCPRCGFMVTTMPRGRHYCPRCEARP